MTNRRGRRARHRRHKASTRRRKRNSVYVELISIPDTRLLDDLWDTIRIVRDIFVVDNWSISYDLV